MEPPAQRLLSDTDPSPFSVFGESSTSPYLIVCDHAGKSLPRALGDLGLSEPELESHIAWDIGAGTVAERLARSLSAFAILQTYSRLAIDCNRYLHVPTSIVEQSEYTVVPGNQNLSPEQAELRAREIFHPYHDRIRSELERREREQLATVLVAVHSFTPRFMGTIRPWHVGVLYGRDTRLAGRLLELLRREPELVVGDNEPYSVSELSDYAVNEYGEHRGLPYVEIEIRQDLIEDETGQVVWAERFARLLPEAVRGLDGVAFAHA